MTPLAGRLVQTYAQTLFDLAGERQAQQAVAQDLEALADLLSREVELVRLLESPCFEIATKQNLLGRLLAGRVTDLTLDFLGVVLGHRRAAFLPKIVDAYGLLWDESQGLQNVEVTVAAALDPGQQERLREDLVASLGGPVKLRLEVHPRVVGGMSVRYNGLHVDNTVTGRLQRALHHVFIKQGGPHP